MPLQLNIHATDACNLRCKYCYVDFEHPATDLPFEALKRIITEAREYGTDRISVEGGEPLVRGDIGEIVDLIRDLGMDCNINTNGLLIPKKIEQVRRTSTFSISLDGPKEVHDALRGKGSFDKAILGIETARAHGIPVYALSVLTKQNRPHVDFMLGLAEKLGFVWVPNSLFFMAGSRIDREQAGSYMIEDDDYRRLLEELLKKKAGGAPIAWSAGTLRYAIGWPETFFRSNIFSMSPEHERKGFRPLRCQAARHFCVMQTNGDLYSCDPLLGYGKAANAVELGFREALSRTTTNGCIACNSLICAEYHQLFSLHIPVILNLLKNYGRSGRR
ncbi:radical SAM protein [Elusimicrobiota bacterium]